jgi:hypothetical protein
MRGILISFSIMSQRTSSVPGSQVNIFIPFRGYPKYILRSLFHTAQSRVLLTINTLSMMLRASDLDAIASKLVGFYVRDIYQVANCSRRTG